MFKDNYWREWNRHHEDNKENHILSEDLFTKLSSELKRKQERQERQDAFDTIIEIAMKYNLFTVPSFYEVEKDEHNITLRNPKQK